MRSFDTQIDRRTQNTNLPISLRCSLAEMLYCTSLMAFVGAGKSCAISCSLRSLEQACKAYAYRPDVGEQALLTPRKLTLLNTTTQKEIQHINYASTVLAVRLNRKR